MNGQQTQETTQAIGTYTGDIPPVLDAIDGAPLAEDGFTKHGLDPDETTTLIAAFPEAEWDILPTGEVYVNHMKYRERLTRVFGAMGWGMRATDALRFDADTGVAYQTWVLMARGVPIALAVGSARYYSEAEKRLDYADTAEAAKSNALTRCCKDLAIGAALYDRRIAEAWKRQYAIKVWRENVKKPEWRRRDAPPFWNEAGEATERAPQATRASNAPAPASQAAPATAAPAPPPAVASTGSPQVAGSMREIGPTMITDVKIKKSGTSQSGAAYTIFTITSEMGAFDTYDEKLADTANAAKNRGVSAILTVIKKADRQNRLWDVLSAVCLMAN